MYALKIIRLYHVRVEILFFITKNRPCYRLDGFLTKFSNARGDFTVCELWFARLSTIKEKKENSQEVSLFVARL